MLLHQLCIPTLMGELFSERYLMLTEFCGPPGTRTHAHVGPFAQQSTKHECLLCRHCSLCLE